MKTILLGLFVQTDTIYVCANKVVMSSCTPCQCNNCCCWFFATALLILAVIGVIGVLRAFPKKDTLKDGHEMLTQLHNLNDQVKSVYEQMPHQKD